MAAGSTSSSHKVVWAALAGNLLVAISKGGVAVFTGSSAMLSEAVHSLVDTTNELLLLYGMRRAARPPDRHHPLGHGRELYFWSFVVAVLVFALGAGVSTYQGIHRLSHPAPIDHPTASFIVLGLAFLFEGTTWFIALRQFNQARGELGLYQAFRRSKNPPAFMVLFEDSAALIGILIAAGGTAAAVWFSAALYDGLASILIGVVLAATALLLARESKSLLIGEPANADLSDSILAIAGRQPQVLANGVMTFQLGPEQIVVALSVEFADLLDATQIEEAVTAIEQQVRAAYPQVVSVFIKPQSASVFRQRRRRD